MSLSLPKKKLSLVFQTITAISRFKKECPCEDFYIDRDEKTMVGFFSEDQVGLAVRKYEARCDRMAD